MPSCPEVLIRLEPSGALSLALPGANNTPRTIPLRPGQVEHILQQVLFALALGEASIGRDGAPTLAQAECWQKHSVWPSANCVFCRKSGRGQSYQCERQGTTRGPGQRVLSERKLGNGVVVRRIAAGQTAAQADAAAKRSRIAAQRLGAAGPEELGL